MNEDPAAVSPSRDGTAAGVHAFAIAVQPVLKTL